MKKISLSIVLFLGLFVQAFSLGNRFFEIRVDVPVSISNSTFAIPDFFHKELVIDLPALHNTVPDTGFSFDLFANPSVSINFDFRKVKFGVKAGAEAQGNLNIGKGLFDFLAVGNKESQEIDVSLGLNADAFLFVDVPVAVNGEKLKIQVKPGFFFPMIHSYIGGSGNLKNKEDDATFVLDVKSTIDIYSPFELSFLNGTSGGMSLNSMDTAKLFETMGFDLAGSAFYEVIDGLDIGGSLRIPIVPGRLKQRSSAGFTLDGKLNLMDMFNGEEEGLTYEKELAEFTTETLETPYKICRPFKFMLGANWHTSGNWFTAYANAGLGIRYPYTSDWKIYPEYLIGCNLSLANILGLSVSSQYMDMIFAHKLGVMLNIRLLEIDVGVSSESSSFLSSFKAAGLGAYVTVCIGF